ncbi:MAG: RagB/SusD family nutrient uptake outer membrane protein [Bacteroidota bacterium]
MKSIKYIVMGAVLLATVSCKNFLAEEPEGFIKTDNYYNTEADAANAVSAVYYLLNSGGSGLQTPYNTLFNTGLNFMADDEFPGPGATQPDVRSMANNLHTSTNLRVYELWQQHYAAIRKANIALEKIPAINFNAALKNRLLAETKFLRALYYFNIVRLFGDVPLITASQNGVTAAEYEIERTPSAQVYAQIELDLKDAAEVLPASYSSPDVGRATKGAALALLAKVYLTKSSLPLNLTTHYQDVITTAEKALSPADGGTGNFNYALQTNYAQVFLPAFKNNSEHIFSAQFKSSSTSNSYLTQGNNQNPRSIRTQVPGLAGSYADQVWFYTVDDATKPGGKDKFFSVFKLYKPGDKRRDVTFVTNFKSPANSKLYGALNDPAIKGSKLDSIPYFNKTWDPSSTAVTSESAANVSIIRYAELLLIHSEAENELNGPTSKAYQSLNKVRNRAGLPNLTEGLTKDQFRDSLYLDRRLELVFEYQRWFDLVREKDGNGNSIFVKSLHKAGKTNAADKHRLHPIPQQELELNKKLTQNPGY